MEDGEDLGSLSKIEKVNFIIDNCCNYTDEQLAVKLGMKKYQVFRIRREHGLKAKRKSKYKQVLSVNDLDFIKSNWYRLSDKKLAKILECKIVTVAKERVQTLKITRHSKRPRIYWTKKQLTFLLENWQKLSDSQIAKKIGKTPGGVRRKRKALRLDKSDLNRKAKFTREELRKMLEEENLSMQKIARRYTITRVRVWQISRKHKLKTQRKKPYWLCEASLLEEKIIFFGGVGNFAKAVKTTRHEVNYWLKTVNLLPRQIQKKIHSRIVSCATCGQEFTRLKSHFRNPQQKEFFCSQECFYAYLRQPK